MNSTEEKSSLPPPFHPWNWSGDVRIQALWTVHVSVCGWLSSHQRRALSHHAWNVSFLSEIERMALSPLASSHRINRVARRHQDWNWHLRTSRSFLLIRFCWLWHILKDLQVGQDFDHENGKGPKHVPNQCLLLLDFLCQVEMHPV